MLPTNLNPHRFNPWLICQSRTGVAHQCLERLIGLAIWERIAACQGRKKNVVQFEADIKGGNVAFGQVRRLLREVELREDIRAAAIFALMLYTGARVSDLVQLELADLMLSERTGTVVFRFGKGNKQRSVPLPLLARQCAYRLISIAARPLPARSYSSVSVAL